MAIFCFEAKTRHFEFHAYSLDEDAARLKAAYPLLPWRLQGPIEKVPPDITKELRQKGFYQQKAPMFRPSGMYVHIE